MEDINRQIDKLIEQGKKLKANVAPKLEEKKAILAEFEKVEN